MNLVLDTLKSARSFTALGHLLGLVAAFGLLRLLGIEAPLLQLGAGALLLFFYEGAAALIDLRARRLKKLAPNAFPFKNLPEDDRAFLQESLMRLPGRSMQRGAIAWLILVGAAVFGGSTREAAACLVLGGIVSVLTQYYGNSAMGRRVAPFYYFEGDSPDGLSKHLPSFRRRLWTWMLGPLLVAALPLLMLPIEGNLWAWLWLLGWALALMVAGLRLFQDLVVSPIEDLGSALARFGEGDFSALLDVTSGDALGVATNLYNKAVRKIDRRFFVRENFGHMVVGEKTEQLFEGGLKLDGEEREVAVIVARIKGERLSLKAFNKFCSVVAECVDKHNGHIDEVGDGQVRALFNAPLKIENAEGQALEACNEIKGRLEVFRAQQRMQNGLVLETGVGFAYGLAQVGLAGPKGRQRYTALGKPLEEAARNSGL